MIKTVLPALLLTAGLALQSAAALTFSASTVPLATDKQVVALIDLNGDGRKDAIISYYGCDCASYTAIALGNAGGGFDAPVEVASPTNFIAAQDLDGDSVLDIIGRTDGQIHFLKGNGDGTFVAGVVATTMSPNEYRPVLIDINNDGKPDLVSPGDPFVMIALGVGDGTFGASTDLAFSGNGYTVVRDVNNDGKPDLITGETNWGSAETPYSGVRITVRLNDGAGNFTGTFSELGEDTEGDSYSLYHIRVGDVDGDGLSDLVALLNIPSSGTLIWVYRNLGSGNFDSTPVQTMLPSDAALTIGPSLLDLDADGRSDLAFVFATYDAMSDSYTARGIKVMKGGVTGAFTDWLTGNDPGDLGVELNSLEFADVSGDSKTDAVLQKGSTDLLKFIQVSSATTPDNFTFTAQTGVALSTWIESNVVTIAGNSAPAALTVSGGEYRINGGAYTTAAGSLNAGDTLQVRVMSSASFGGVATVSVNAGGVVASFQVTSLSNMPDAFSFAAVRVRDTNTWVESETITISGVASTSIAVSGGEYRINNGSFVSTAGSINAGDRLTVRVRSATSFDVQSAVTVNVGGFSATFRATAVPNRPDSFSFPAVSDAIPGALVESQTVTISGLFEAITASIGVGEISVNGGAYATSATLNNGDTLRLRVKAAAQVGTTVNATLTIGTWQTTFQVSTRYNALGNLRWQVAKNAYAVATTSDALYVTPPITPVAQREPIVPLDSWIETAPVTLDGLYERVAATPAGGELSVDGGPFSAAPQTVTTGSKLVLRLRTGPDQWSKVYSASLTLLEQTFEFKVRTTAGKYIGGVSPSLQEGMPANTWILSNPASLVLPFPVRISAVSGGEFSVNDGPFSSQPGWVGPSDKLILRTKAPTGGVGRVTLTIEQTRVDFTVTNATTLTFYGQTSLDETSPALLVGDVDRDGIDDIVLNNRLLLGQRSGFRSVDLPSRSDQLLALVDLNQDGLPEILSADGNNLMLGRNLGTARFALPVAVSTLPAAVHDLTPHWLDVNGDGLPDQVLVVRPSKLAIALNLGGLKFGDYQWLNFPSLPVGVAAVDGNRDGWVDLLVSLANGELHHLLGQAGQTYAPARILPFPANPLIAARDAAGAPLVWALGSYILFDAGGAKVPVGGSPGLHSIPDHQPHDFDGDGIGDLFGISSNGAGVFLGTGAGWTSAQTRWQAGAATRTSGRGQLGAGDVNGDGRADFVELQNGRLTVWLNGVADTPMSFGAQREVAPGSVVESNEIVLPAKYTSVNISGGEYRVNNGPWKSGFTFSLQPGDRITVRVTAPDQFAAGARATLMLDGLPIVFDVYTQVSLPTSSPTATPGSQGPKPRVSLTLCGPLALPAGVETSVEPWTLLARGSDSALEGVTYPADGSLLPGLVSGSVRIAAAGAGPLLAVGHCAAPATAYLAGTGAVAATAWRAAQGDLYVYVETGQLALLDAAGAVQVAAFAGETLEFSAGKLRLLRLGSLLPADAPADAAVSDPGVLYWWQSQTQLGIGLPGDPIGLYDAATAATSNYFVAELAGKPGRLQGQDLKTQVLAALRGLGSGFTADATVSQTPGMLRVTDGKDGRSSLLPGAPIAVTAGESGVAVAVAGYGLVDVGIDGAHVRLAPAVPDTTTLLADLRVLLGPQASSRVGQDGVIRIRNAGGEIALRPALVDEPTSKPRDPACTARTLSGSIAQLAIARKFADCPDTVRGSVLVYEHDGRRYRLLPAFADFTALTAALGSSTRADLEALVSAQLAGSTVRLVPEYAVLAQPPAAMGEQAWFALDSRQFVLRNRDGSAQRFSIR